MSQTPGVRFTAPFTGLFVAVLDTGAIFASGDDAAVLTAAVEGHIRHELAIWEEEPEPGVLQRWTWTDETTGEEISLSIRDNG